MIPRDGYTLLKLGHETTDRYHLASSFKYTFRYANETVSIDATLQVIKTNIFKEISVFVWSLPQWTAIVQNMMDCYNILGTLEEPKDNDPCDA